jgi:predicted nucleic acid-binding protein
MEAIIDTNVLVYETVEDSLYHEEATKKMGELKMVHLPTNVLIEFILLMKRLGLSEGFIAKKVLRILEGENFKLVDITSSDFKESLSLIAREGTSVKRINDKMILALARRKGLPILTYDKQLKQQAGELRLKTI